MGLVCEAFRVQRHLKKGKNKERSSWKILENSREKEEKEKKKKLTVEENEVGVEGFEGFEGFRVEVGHYKKKKEEKKEKLR